MLRSNQKPRGRGCVSQLKMVMLPTATSLWLQCVEDHRSQRGQVACLFHLPSQTLHRFVLLHHFGKNGRLAVSGVLGWQPCPFFKGTVRLELAGTFMLTILNYVSESAEYCPRLCALRQLPHNDCRGAGPSLHHPACRLKVNQTAKVGHRSRGDRPCLQSCVVHSGSRAAEACCWKGGIGGPPY